MIAKEELVCSLTEGIKRRVDDNVEMLPRRFSINANKGKHRSGTES